MRWASRHGATSGRPRCTLWMTRELRDEATDGEARAWPASGSPAPGQELVVSGAELAARWSSSVKRTGQGFTVVPIRDHRALLARGSQNVCAAPDAGPDPRSRTTRRTPRKAGPVKGQGAKRASSSIQYARERYRERWGNLPFREGS